MMSPIAPPPAVVNQLSDLLAVFANLDDARQIVKDMQDANAKQQALLNSGRILARMKEIEEGVWSEAEMLRDQAKGELDQLLAQKAEVEELKGRLQTLNIRADERLRDADTRLAEAEAIKADAQATRQKMLDLVAARLTND